MVKLYRSNRIYWRQLWAAVMMTALMLTGGTGCKKKSKGGGSAAPPAADINAADATGECNALTTLDLGPANPAALRLTGVDLEEFKIGSFSSARITFKLAEGLPPPSKFVYYACSAKNKKNCKLGSSATTVDVNSVIPAGSVSLKAWACITPDRLPGPAANYQNNKL